MGSGGGGGKLRRASQKNSKLVGDLWFRSSWAVTRMRVPECLHCVCVCVYYVFQSIIFCCYCFPIWNNVCNKCEEGEQRRMEEERRSMEHDDFQEVLYYIAENYSKHEDENGKYFFCKTKQSLAFMDLFTFPLFFLLFHSIPFPFLFLSLSVRASPVFFAIFIPKKIHQLHDI